MAKTRRLYHLLLRFLAFAATLSAIIVMVSSHERTSLFRVSFEAKYTNSPAFKYVVIANSVVTVYGFLVFFLPAESLLWRLVVALDLVLGAKIKELSRVQTEMRSTNTNINSGSDQMLAISTKLPEDKAEFKNNFPKPWCDGYGNVVLDVVKKEFTDNAKEKHENLTGWTTFEDDENLHPNLFVHQDKSLRSSSINPFSHAYI